MYVKGEKKIVVHFQGEKICCVFSGKERAAVNNCIAVAFAASAKRCAFVQNVQLCSQIFAWMPRSLSTE